MISKIKNFLKKENLDALIINRTDSFLGEHYPPEKNQLFQVTHFSGSAGLSIVSQNKQILFVDSRYTEQAKAESDFQVFEIPTQTTPLKWMLSNMNHARIGYCKAHRSVMWVSRMSIKLAKANVQLVGIDSETWSTLFPHQEEKEITQEFDYDLSFCGETTSDKIKRIVPTLQQNHLDAFVFGSPDSVSWILNKRSLWVHDYPVIFKRLIVFSNESYCELNNDTLPLLKNKKIGVDLSSISQELCEELAQEQAQICDIPDIAAELKAVKNEIEQDNIRQACLFESHALCRFLAWIETNKTSIDEFMCETKLQELRSENPLYKGDSFDTIAAVGEHAARAHYHASKESSFPLTSAPMLMVDTGGNYLNGTTDMTRTICIGNPTELMKKRYTQVLQGHIALARTQLNIGDFPAKLDQNAHSFLQQDHVDYYHATGHGIGLFLDVHEAPPVIYEMAETPLFPGMVFSNEPGYYDAEQGFGIRLENMILTQEGNDNKLILENLLWVPFDGRLINFDMLSPEEKEWLKQYHLTIQERILPTLSKKEQAILEPLLSYFTHLN